MNDYDYQYTAKQAFQLIYSFCREHVGGPLGPEHKAMFYDHIKRHYPGDVSAIKDAAYDAGIANLGGTGDRLAKRAYYAKVLACPGMEVPTFMYKT